MSGCPSNHDPARSNRKASGTDGKRFYLRQRFKALIAGTQNGRRVIAPFHLDGDAEEY